MTVPRTGAAVLYLKRGEYVAEWAELRHGIVTFCGHLRVKDLTGERSYGQRTCSHRLEGDEWIAWEVGGPT